MEEFLKNLGENTWYILISFIGALASVFAVPIAFYFYFKQKKDKSPFYATRSNNLVRNLSGTSDNIKVLFDNEEVANLTVTSFAFWNAGK